ncbi:MAG: PqqD family protein [Lachnospiraceae bacterium]|nr:PqqD family protein [Lachnospiraceae bacterium]
MRQNPNFIKVERKDGVYLLPVGQSISDHKQGIRINATGAFLWAQLATECTLDELIERTAQEFALSASMLPALKQDILSFLNTLNLNGMLLVPMPIPTGTDGFYRTLSIAGLSVNLYGLAEDFAEDFTPFYTAYDPHPQQTVQVLYGTPAVCENGVTVIRNKELTLLEQPETYILLFHADSRVRELHLRKDAALVVCYCLPGETLQEDLLHALRFAFLYLAAQHDLLAIHSASVLYRDKAWLFSAPAGTGKSTHAALWHDLLEVPYLNGDLNLIALRPEPAGGQPKVVVYGLPWCGTSGISSTQTHPLGGIVFLSQAPADSVSPITGDERALSISRRLISPCWNGTMLLHQLDLTAQMAEHIFLCRLACTKDPSALKVIRAEIDRYLDGQPHP